MALKKPINVSSTFATLCLGASLMSPLSATAEQSNLKSGTCDGVSSEEYICGPISAEELVQLKNTDWVFGSQIMREFLGIPAGTIHLINSKSRQWKNLPVDGREEDFEIETFSDCPSVLTGEEFSGHGMTIAYPKGEDPLIYAVNHAAGRESVEVFRINTVKEFPELKWVGCIPSPGDDYLNTLVALDDGGIAATKFFEIENRDSWFPDALQGKPTGEVYEWHASTGWKMVPGTRMSAPNGITIAPDGDFIVAEWGAQKLHKFPREGFKGALSVDVAGRPDNIHWSSDGTLLVVAQTSDMGPFGACIFTNAAVCPSDFEVIAIDPDNLELDVLLSLPTKEGEFAFGTSALKIGSEIWVGTIRGNKIATISQ